MRLAILFTSLVIVFLSCKDAGPNPNDMVGTYKVTGKLKDNLINTAAIKDSLNDGIKEMEKSLGEAKETINEEFDLSSIDTTTTEGKIEYAAKQFGKTISGVDLDMGDLSDKVGSSVSQILNGSQNFLDDIVQNLNTEITLQADGDIKSSGGMLMLSLGFNNVTWEVIQDDFIIKNKDKSELHSFKILNKSSDGFDLDMDGLTLHFSKIKE